MPLPDSVTWMAGHFALPASFGVDVDGGTQGRALDAVVRVCQRLSQFWEQGLACRPVDGEAALTIRIKAARAYPSLGDDEAYRLIVRPEGISIDAASDAGAVWALQSLRQLVCFEGGRWRVPCCIIEDRPRLAWRGMLLDVSRHFMPMAAVMGLLDGMEMVKLNVLHLHLSDDQGFRLECLTHPRLHEAGSEGLYYTQEEMGDLIQAAAARGIRIVPEFGLPGHSVSWQVAYPEFSAALAPPVRVGEVDGAFSVPVDPSKEAFYVFLDEFVGEMAGLFPDPYFHIGGDEVSGRAWKENPEIAAFSKAKGFERSRDLQAYFTGRYAGLVGAHGKIPVGWEEVLHGGVPRSVVMHLWRDGVYQPTLKGHPVLVSWNYYLDLQQPAWWLHRRDPFDFKVEGASSKQMDVIGAEMANWSETLDGTTLDLRTWPRAAAVAERFWSARRRVDAVDRCDLYARLKRVSRELDRAGLVHEAHPHRYAVEVCGADSRDVKILERFAALIEPAAYPFLRRRRVALERTWPKLFQIPAKERISDVDRFVDNIAAENMVVRAFEEKVGLLLQGAAQDDFEAAVRRQLEEWRALSGAARKLIRRTPRLRRERLTRLAGGVGVVASVGLAALDARARGRRLSGLHRRWLSYRLRPYRYEVFYMGPGVLAHLLSELRKPDVLNQCHIGFAPAVEQLLEAAS